ncbi:chitin binding peritrophin-A domain-containing protein [Streptomyces sp. NPDC058674]|uniref:chitin binding peritrophin-A domain-containing protein n=1 Tax=Streptomyces sp. NPDC058674 TaxID=3346592 RepID=UPI00366884AC
MDRLEAALAPERVAPEGGCRGVWRGAASRAGASRLVDFYSCAGKPDGNYIHPSDCTKFMSCVAQEYAYERSCADCHPNPDNCPNGRLHYDAASDACLWSYEAGCVTEQTPR